MRTRKATTTRSRTKTSKLTPKLTIVKSQPADAKSEGKNPERLALIAAIAKIRLANFR